MDASLLISCKHFSDEELHLFAHELVRTLKETEISSELVEQSAKIGEKGGPVTIGMILLTALSSGTVMALFNVLKSYCERRTSLEIILVRPDGKKFILHAENLTDKQISQTIKMAELFLME